MEFVELQEPIYHVPLNNDPPAWLIVSNGRVCRYLDMQGNISGLPCFFHNINDAWEAASEYYTRHNMVYPYVLSSDGVIVFIGEKLIEKIRNAFSGSIVMEFEE